MKMNEIYVGLETELQKIEPAYIEAEKSYNYHLAEAEKAEAEMNKMKENVMALREAMAALQKGNFAPSEEEKKAEEREQAKKEELARAKVKPAKSWVRRKGEIGQFKPDGEIINSWTSQRSAAISLRWSPTGISKFMKLDNATQVRKKGFYLAYMG